MSRIKVIDSIIGHIKANFGNELDKKVRTPGIGNSAFWPGSCGESNHCGYFFHEAQVDTDRRKLKNPTVQDVLDCLEACAQEWRVEQIGTDWYVSSRQETRHVGPVQMTGKNHYDQALVECERLNLRRK